MEPRTMRVRMAASAAPRVAAGKNVVAEAPPRPETGSQPSLMEKRVISRGPSAKLGTARPSSVKTPMARSDVSRGDRAREDAGRNRDGGADEKGEEGELERGGIAFENDVTHGRLKFEGLAEIAADDLAEIVRHIERGAADRGRERGASCDDLAGRGAFTKHLFDRIAGNDVNREEKPW